MAGPIDPRLGPAPIDPRTLPSGNPMFSSAMAIASYQSELIRYENNARSLGQDPNRAQDQTQISAQESDPSHHLNHQLEGLSHNFGGMY